MKGLKTHVSAQLERIPITRDSAYHLLQQCERRKDLHCSRRLQLLMLHSGLTSISVLGDHLIRLFVHHSSLLEANESFHRIGSPTVYTWAAIILASSKLRHGLLALELYQQMQLSDVKSDKYVLVAVIKACVTSHSVVRGRIIHGKILRSGFYSDIVVGNALIHMYVKCGNLDEAKNAFDNLPNRDIVSWGSIVAGHAQHGNGLWAVNCLEKMEEEGIKPDIILWNTIITGYAQKGNFLEAFQCFRKMQQEGIQPNVVSWNAMIAGYAHHGKTHLALDCYDKMQQEGIQPDPITFSSILNACASVDAIEQGIAIHKQIIQAKLQLDAVLAGTLVDMYAKSGKLEEAREIFDHLPERDVVSWGAMISGYAQHGRDNLALECLEQMQQEGVVANLEIWNAIIAGYALHENGLPALECFKQMQYKGIQPSEITFLSILKACSSMGALEQGKLMHEQIIREGLKVNVLGNSLVDMYAKCGNIEQAHQVFDKLVLRDIVSWGAMIAGYAQHGKVHLVLECFGQMQKAGIKPDEMSLASILIGCSRAGMVDEGRWYFISMRDHHKIRPADCHCNCMVDLLGRAGFFKEAQELIQTTMVADNVGWTSLLGACRMHTNVEAGRECFYHILASGPDCDVAYILMSNIYADAHMEEEVYKLKQLKMCANHLNK